MVMLDRDEYFNNVDKEVKNGTLLYNVFTSFYINKKSLKLNKRNKNKNISFINNDVNINQNNQDINKMNKLELLKDNNNISNSFTDELSITDNKVVLLTKKGWGTNSKNI